VSSTSITWFTALTAGLVLAAGCRQMGSDAEWVPSGGGGPNIFVGTAFDVPSSVQPGDQGAEDEDDQGDIGAFSLAGRGGSAGTGGLGSFAGFGDLGSSGSAGVDGSGSTATASDPCDGDVQLPGELQVEGAPCVR